LANSRLWTRALVCLVGLGVSLLLAGAVVVARRRTLAQATTTFYTPLSGEAEWEGDWKLSALGADPGEIGTERVTIPFVGTDFALRVRRGNYRGYFFVSVDGEPANRLPQEDGAAYLVLTSPDYAPQVVTIPVAADLDDGPHVAVLVAERGWDQWPLVGWSVSRTPDMTVYRRVLTGLVALGLAFLLGTVWWGAMWQRGRGAEGQGSGGAGGRGGGGAREQGGGGAEEPFAIRHSSFAILVAAAAFYFSPWLPLTVVSGLALTALVLLRLDVGLALVVATAPFYRYPRPLLGKAFSMAEILTLLCMLSWGVRQVANRQSSLANRQSPIALDLAVFFFVLVATVSTIAAEYRHVALRELRVVILEPALFYLMLRTSRLDNREVWRIVDLFVLGGVAVAIIGLVQYALGVNIITAEEGFRRLRSVYGSPNNAGLYLGRALPLLVAVTLFGGSRGRRLAYGAAVVPVGLAVLLSFSKGALILGVPLSLLTLGVLAGGRWLWASLGTAVVAAIAALPLLRTPRFASLLDTHSGTTFFRLQLWRSSWTMFRDYLWLGVGPDNFLYHYRSRYILPAAWQEPDLSHPHNILLDYGCRMGLCGLVTGLWMQVAFWRLALPLRRLADGPAESVEARDRRALALGLMGSMVGFLAHGLVDVSYFVIDLAFVFFLTLGVVVWLAARSRYQNH